MELLRLREGRVPLVGQVGIHLDRHETVDAVRPIPHGPEHVARTLDVLDRQREEHLLRIVRVLELGAELLVVPVAGRERLLEDGRIGRDPDDGVLLDEALQLARFEHLARERVDPDADSVLGKLVQPAACHTSTLAVRGTTVEWRGDSGRETS